MTNTAPWDGAGTANCGLSAPAQAVGQKGTMGLFAIAPLLTGQMHAQGCNQLPKAASNVQHQALSCSVSDEYPAQKATGDPARES